MRYYNIPIFVPHLGCPFNCVFCNQRKITGQVSCVDENSVKQTIEEHLKLLPKNNCDIEIAFFGGSFTGIDDELQERLLSCAYLYVGKSNISGIRVSTRPDYINHTVLKRLLKYGATTIELGVQSMDSEVLLASNRGHTPKNVENAVKLIREYHFKLGLQMMTGLPKDNPKKAMDTAKSLISLNPDFVRIYPTLVISGTELENMYKDGIYKPQTLNEAVDLCHNILKEFKKNNIPAIRIGLQNTEEISPNGAVVAGPFHSAFGELVEAQMYFDKIAQLIKEIQSENITIEVNPCEISKAVGQKKSNIIRAKKEFGKNIKIKANKIIVKGNIAAKITP